MKRSLGRPAKYEATTSSIERVRDLVVMTLEEAVDYSEIVSQGGKNKSSWRRRLVKPRKRESAPMVEVHDVDMGMEVTRMMTKDPEISQWEN